MDKNLPGINFSSRLSKQRQIKKNFSKVLGINGWYKWKNKFLKDLSLLEQSHKKKMTTKSDQCQLCHNTAVHNIAETVQTWLPCIMCTCSMHLLFVRHHVHFFCNAGKVVILNPVYSTRVTLLQCGFPRTARKLFFTCTAGSRWAKASIFISLSLPLWPWRQLPIRGLFMDSIEASWGYCKTPRTCLLSQRLGNMKNLLPNKPPTIPSPNLHYDTHILKQVPQEWNICPTNGAFLKLCGW